MKKLKFEAILSEKVLSAKVDIKAMEPWVTHRLTELLQVEDDILVDYIINCLADEKQPNAKKMQLYLTGFTGAKNARIFMKELWTFLVSLLPPRSFCRACAATAASACPRRPPPPAWSPVLSPPPPPPRPPFLVRLRWQLAHPRACGAAPLAGRRPVAPEREAARPGAGGGADARHCEAGDGERAGRAAANRGAHQAERGLAAADGDGGRREAPGGVPGVPDKPLWRSPRPPTATGFDARGRRGAVARLRAAPAAKVGKDGYEGPTHHEPRRLGGDDRRHRRRRRRRRGQGSARRQGRPRPGRRGCRRRRRHQRQRQCRRQRGRRQRGRREDESCAQPQPQSQLLALALALALPVSVPVPVPVPVPGPPAPFPRTPRRRAWPVVQPTAPPAPLPAPRRRRTLAPLPAPPRVPEPLPAPPQVPVPVPVPFASAPPPLAISAPPQSQPLPQPSFAQQVPGGERGEWQRGPAGELGRASQQDPQQVAGASTRQRRWQR